MMSVGSMSSVNQEMVALKKEDKLQRANGGRACRVEMMPEKGMLR